MSEFPTTLQRRLAAAIAASDVVEVRAALAAGAAPDLGEFPPSTAIVDDDEPAAPGTPGDPMLIRAVVKGDVEIVRALIDAGADLELQGWESSYSWIHDETRYDFQGTALELAIGAGHLGIVQLLLQRGARADTAITKALEHPQVLRLLLDQGLAPHSDHLQACLRGDGREHAFVEALQLLLDHGADPNGLHQGKPVLAWAIFWGRVDAARALVAAGAAPLSPALAQSAVDATSAFASAPHTRRALETAHALGADVNAPPEKPGRR